MLRPLFSIAPMLKSLTATMLKTSRSYSRPKTSSSHRVAAFVLVAVADPDGEPDLLARAGLEVVTHRDQIAGDEREEIGRLRVRVDPFRPVPAVARLAALDRIAVRQQHRKARLLSDDRCRVPGHDIRPIGEIGDPAKAFRLALSAEISARHVEPREGGVTFG